MENYSTPLRVRPRRRRTLLYRSLTIVADSRATDLGPKTEMRFAIITKVVAALALLAGCATYDPAMLVNHGDLVAPYRLDSGDQLRMVVFGQDNLSNTYIVDQAGAISVPLIGNVSVRNRSTAEVANLVKAKLQKGFVRDPNVSIEVVRYRPFFAMGEVAAAGQYSFAPGMTVQSAIATAGGFTPRADKRFVKVSRRTGGEVETISLDMTDPIKPGDTLYVQERIF